jgi:PAS domain-containing protein
VQTLNGIAPHLGRALQLRRTFAQQDAKLASLGETIDRLAVGVIVLDQEGGAIHVNRAAREITARNDGLWLDRTGVPHAAQRDADRALVKLCADVRLGDAGGIVRIPRRDEARPYSVMAAPLPARTALTGTQTDATPVLILIHDPSAQVLGIPETIAAIFALPIATARLVAALAEGTDVKSYAEQQGITTDAVKFHLKTAFAKPGCAARHACSRPSPARSPTSAFASADRRSWRALPSPRRERFPLESAGSASEQGLKQAAPPSAARAGRADTQDARWFQAPITLRFQGRGKRQSARGISHIAFDAIRGICPPVAAINGIFQPGQV